MNIYINNYFKCKWIKFSNQRTQTGWMDKKTRPVYMLSTRNPLQTSRHILIKLTKTKHKERILKTTKKKQRVTYKGNSKCLTADLSAETLQARREWQDIFKVLKGKKSTTKITLPGKDLIQNWWRNKKTFQTSKS